jgi:hypothetical protein
MTFAHSTKYREVSSDFPGPIIESHQPGLGSALDFKPAACASPDNAWNTRMAFDRSSLSFP